MELKIYNPTEEGFVKAIEWNHEEIKKEISEKVAYYNNLVYTDDQIKDAKADRATLRKFIDTLEGKRKEIKKQCLAPYEAFEKQMKEITAIVNEPVALIDKQIKEYEEKQKQDKLESIKAYWHELLQADKIPASMTFEMLFDAKWLNATATMKSIKTAIEDAIDKFAADMDTLADLPEFSFEAQQTYISTLDIRKALDEAHRLSEMAKKKAEQERLKEALSHPVILPEDKVIPPVDDAKEEVSESFENFIPTFAKESEKEWAVVKVKMSADDKTALEQYLKDNNLEFKFM